MVAPAGEKDFWDKLAVLSGFTAAVLVPVAIALFGHFYAEAASNRAADLQRQELARKWVELSLEILRDPGTAQRPGDETDEVPLRRWAVKVINTYMDKDIRLDSTQQEELATAKTTLPESRVQRVEGMQAAALRALLDQNIDAAIEQMTAAHQEWPDFRTVWEALQLMRSWQQSLRPGADPDWQRLYDDLLQRMDPRGIPADVRQRLRDPT
jgi:hypothetical protein